MKYLGVIIGQGRQTLSPIFQQAALDALRLDIVYEAWPTTPDGLVTRVKGMRSASVLGGNVTIPHKEPVIPLMDEIDGPAAQIGAVNTIVNRDGRLVGCNTDVEGFLRALREDGGFDAAGKQAIVVGAGGSARAVVLGLAQAGAARVSVINRTLTRAQALAGDLQPLAVHTVIEAFPASDETWSSAAVDSVLLVSCVPGSDETAALIPPSALHNRMLIYDIAYSAHESPLIEAARQRGAATLDGLPMLVYQGAASFKLWTGSEPPLDIMFDAARTGLARQLEGASP